MLEGDKAGTDTKGLQGRVCTARGAVADLIFTAARFKQFYPQINAKQRVLGGQSAVPNLCSCPLRREAAFCKAPSELWKAFLGFSP